jgi:5,5'-dehydrodivanillate O-demethylase oxygenase subunit
MTATIDPKADPAPLTEPIDSQRTGPGTLAGRYLRLFWHPIYRSQDLEPGRTKPIRIMSEDFTLYRGESGQPHLVAFRCAHRGTQLSTGWVEGDELRCFYHGWKYGPDGQCTEQPAEPEPFCNRIRIRSYPVQDYLGLVFAYLGEGDPPTLPRYPDFETKPSAEVNIYVRCCNFFNNLDNDNVHTYFVHRRPGNDFREWNGRIPALRDQEDEWGVTTTNIRPDGKIGSVTHRAMPNIRLRKQGRTGPSNPRLEDSIAWHVPIDDESHYAVQLDVALSPDERPRPTDSPDWVEPNELGELVLQGRLDQGAVETETSLAYARVRSEQLPAELRPNDAEWALSDKVKVQDVISQVGQGQIADRTTEHLGHSDSTVILLRRIWERELRNLAEGRPLKQWGRPERQVTGQ